MQSDNQTSQEVTDALTYQSFGDDRWNGQGIKIFYSSDEGFNKEDMLKEVMGGYTASTPKA
nr:phage tail protein [Weissella paramesenteroides]